MAESHCTTLSIAIPGRANDLTDMVFGGLTAIEVASTKPRMLWVCLCECGRRSVVSAGNLASGHSTSCGCRRPALVSRSRRRHGLTHTSIYTKWVNMRNRCDNPGNDSYALYGGRGICVCDEWDRSFEAFLRDMGKCPEGMTLERIDSNGDYTPINCTWVSPQDQANNRRNNRRFEWRGRRLTLRQICTEVSVNYELARRRLKRRWPLSEALFHPKGKRRCADGRATSIT